MFIQTSFGQQHKSQTQDQELVGRVPGLVGTGRRCNEMRSVKNSVDLMHCLDTSLIGGKATCFGFTPGLWVAPSCFVALLLELALWQPRCLTQVSDCSRGDLLLFTSEVTFEDPPFLGFLFPQRETPLLKECLCLWAPYLALGPCLWHVALFPFLWSQR